MQCEPYYIPFGSQIALKNSRDNKFLCASDLDEKVSASGVHPTLSYSGCSHSQEFTIFNAQNREYRGLLTLGANVFLVVADGRYLVYDATEEVQVEHLQSAANSKKVTKWTMLDSENSGIKRPVTVYDEIVLKTVFGELVVDDKGVVFANGQGTAPESTWQIMKSTVPFIPSWAFTRSNLGHNDIVLRRSIYTEGLVKQRRRGPSEDVKQLRQFPVDRQEQLFLDDLMYSLAAIEGSYIKKQQVAVEGHMKTFEFAVEPHLEAPTCDESLLCIVNKILPLCNQYESILLFINLHSQFEYGLVSHAACEAMRSLVKEYQLRLTQIETEFSRAELTLQKLWFYLQPCIRTVESMGKFVGEAERLKGGALLNAIYKCMESASDLHHKKLYKFLIEKAAVPYLETLSKWVHYGIISDPYGEFMVQEVNREKLNSDYTHTDWEQRFEFREGQIPLFLQKLAGKVLFTGKYLTVIRECGYPVESPHTEELDPKKNPKLLSSIKNHREFLEPIEHAYNWAASTLLTLLFEEKQLLQRLKSLKHYFFLDFGDFFVHFIDSAEEELNKHIKHISIEKLESLLDLSLRTSCTNNDPFKEDVTCELQSYTLSEQLYALHNVAGATARSVDMPILTSAQRFKGVEAFVINYKVAWPLTLIISRYALTKYQLIFRHLFFCKYVEKQLCDTWLLHQSTKELNLRSAFASSYCLIQRMLHFIKNYVYYMAVEVLEEKSHHLSEALKTVQTIDEIMHLHSQFLDECLKECLLMDQELFAILNKIIWVCSYFAEMIQNHTKSMEVDDLLISQVAHESARNPTEERKNKIEQKTNATMKVMVKHQYRLIIEEYTSRFDKQFLTLIKMIRQNKTNTETHLINLIIRLDYNGYYSDCLMANEI